jgi:hypothetical protein
MDPERPTLFEARAEWFQGRERASLEDLVRKLGGKSRRDQLESPEQSFGGSRKRP